MKYSSSFVASVLACLASASSLAQSGEETVVLLPEGAERPDVVTAAIDLPKDANGNYRPSVNAVDRSAKGHATANEARENGRAFGAQMAANAANNRETHARETHPDHPTPPSPPTPPETPVGPPNTPGTPPVSPPGRP